MEQVEDTQHTQQDKENTGGCPDVDGKRFPGGGWGIPLWHSKKCKQTTWFVSNHDADLIFS